MKPQCLIVLNDQLVIQDNLTFICSVKKSKYNYPLLKSEEKKNDNKKVEKKDVLSALNRINIRKALRVNESNLNNNDMNDVAANDTKVEQKQEEIIKEEEPDFFELHNPCRIL